MMGESDCLKNRARGAGKLLKIFWLSLLALVMASSSAIAAEMSKSVKEPESMDDLFANPPTAPKKPAAKTEPSSMPATTLSPNLLPQAGEAADSPMPASKPQSPSLGQRLTGLYQNDLAYTYADQKHWSRFNNMLDVAGQGRTQGWLNWKLGARINFDPIYDLTNYYSQDVRKDQRFEAMIREAYVDFFAGDLDFRLGRQHIIWGEMVGLFFADVVSAKDMRQFILPDFDIIRIPQWAARAEYFHGDFHAEGVWIPYISYDKIGKPGSEFFPLNPGAVTGYQTVITAEKQSAGAWNGAYGARLSYLKDGWDVSGFYYSAKDTSPAFSRQVAGSTITYSPVHNRIRQIGATLGKDLGATVLKAEAIYTKDKLFSTTNAAEVDGLVEQNILDYIVGLEWSFPQETRFNAQLFQRWFPNHAAGIVPNKTESGFSMLLSTQALHHKLEPELLIVRSLNRDDWSAQLKANWRVDGSWRLAIGADIFSGPSTGLFGQFDGKDRIYTEARYNF